MNSHHFNNQAFVAALAGIFSTGLVVGIGAWGAGAREPVMWALGTWTVLTGVYAFAMAFGMDKIR